LSKFGITPDGFKRKTYVDLMKEAEEKLKSRDMFGENIDFTQQDPLYQFTAPIMLMFSELWEVAEHTFYSASPKFSEGNNLSNTGKFIGIARKQGNKATGEVTFKGDKNIKIDKDFIISTEDGVMFKTTEDAVIGEVGEVTVPIIAMHIGESGNVPAGTITTIVKPILGLDSVTNANASGYGQNRETDLEFRERYANSTSQKATNIYNSIKSFILEITGVKDVLVIENDTTKELKNIPPKSFHTIVLGGEENKIAEAIFEKKPAGIQAFGSNYIEVKDSQGQIHKIGFSRPVKKPIYFKVTITKNFDFPTDGNSIIKQTIKDYIDSLHMNKDVVLYKVISAIDKSNVNGIEDIDITVSTDGVDYNSNNILINDLEVADTSLDKIEVV
jgi:uncharacterized phage protein gp47/JayE